MISFKSRNYIFASISCLTIILVITLINLIRDTFRYIPKNEAKYNSFAFSYEIESSDKILIDKLSKKFDIDYEQEQLPNIIKNAFISAEDKRFFSHSGIDLKGLIRASWNNLISGSIREGGSSITQQVARLLFLNNDLNLGRKIKEIIISLILDFRFSKDQILKLYLNRIYLGSGAYGVNEASQIYFGKLIDELTLSEVALLAGLAPAPTIYSPFNNSNLAIDNRNKVLEAMYQDGYISQTDYKNALSEKIILRNYNSEFDPSKNKVLIEFILNEAKEELAKIEGIEQDSLIKIKSSINLHSQKEAEKIIKKITPINLEIGLLSIESNTGFIRTMITGKNPYKNEFNRVTSAIRPLGSTFKIIPYIGALSDGYKLNDKVLDTPQCWKDYCPKNYSGQYEGRISLIKSFENSSNLVPIKITDKLGLKIIIQIANKFGLGYEQEMEEYLPLAIGAYSDSLLNITNAYSALNNNGGFIKPSIIEKITFNNDEFVLKKKIKSEKIIDISIANSINKILENSVSEGTGIAAYIPNKRVRGKTGTSDGNRDLWFIGSIDNLTTGVWLGLDNNKKTSFDSGDAANIWKIFVNNVLKQDLK